jgi:cytochrome c oxidase cbb3-type subunit 3
VSDSKNAPEADLLDHEYDGIKEFDNPMPRWWVAMFWATAVYAVGYIGFFHMTGRGQSVEESFQEDLRLAREERAKNSLKEAPSEVVLSKLMADPALMQDAKVTFGERCAVCHGADGQGLIGPNLTDGSWIHGKGQLMDIFQVVSHGVSTKGMPAWELTLQPIEIRKLVAFVGTLRGKNLPGKAAEGQPVAAVP